MKYFMLFFIALTIAGCGSVNEGDDVNQSEAKSSTVSESEPSDANNNISASFQNLHFRLGVDDVEVTGKAKSTNDEIYYRVEQGEDSIVEETEIKLDKPEDVWDEIDFTFDFTPEMEENEDELFVIIYAKGENEEEINPNYLAVDLNLQYNQ